MDTKGRYRNPVRFGSVLRVVFVFVFLVSIGVVIVCLRNKHVSLGDDIRAVEAEVSELDRATQMWELRLAGALDRGELGRRLRWMGSDLKPISSRRVLRVAPDKVER